MRNPPRFPCFLFSLLAAVPIATANAATWYVDASAISGAGTSWNEPFNTIGEAVAAATNSDVIKIAAGEYAGEVLLDKDLKIIGGFSGDEESDELPKYHQMPKNTVVMAGDLPCLMCSGNCEIINLQLSGSKAAGMTIGAGADVTVQFCLMEGNMGPVSGGGLSISRSQAEILSCTIENNTSAWSGGGVIIERASTVTLRDCVIRGNDSEAGGGIAVIRSTLVMSNCRIERNRAIPGTPDSEGVGGGLYCVNSIVDVENCFFDQNLANVGDQFTGLNSQGQPITFTNCTFYKPFSGNDAQIVWESLAVPTIQNCIVSGDSPIAHLSDENLLANVTNSNIQGGYPGEGNISDDPLFRDPANGDFRLQHNSPCIDTGAMVGPADDLDGNPRPIDIPGVGREGDNAFDMGAFEFQLLIPPPDPRTDINQDGLRDATDLLLLLQDWHRVSGPSGN